jgi:hypothetical protein
MPMVAGDLPAEGVSGTPSGSRLPDGWGLMLGTVRLATGESAGDCGVVYYTMTVPADGIPGIGICADAEGAYTYPLPAGT